MLDQPDLTVGVQPGAPIDEPKASAAPRPETACETPAIARCPSAALSSPTSPILF